MRHHNRADYSALTYLFTPIPNNAAVAHAKVQCGCGGHIDLGVR